MTFGLTSTGFLKKRLADLTSELEADFQTAFGAAVKITGDSVMGQLIGIFAERLAEVWELGEAVYGAAYPDSADGVPLDHAVAITGHSRLGATYSTVTVTCGTNGVSPVTLPVGRQIRVTATGATFETTEEVEIPAGGTVDVECRATVTGALAAPAGTLTEIVTPVSGWDTATNAADAEVGRDQETDADLRIRRRTTLQIAQAGGVAAIEARLLELSGVEFAGVAENRTDTTDGNGRPPHSIEAVVLGGVTVDVAETIYAAKPAGIATYGSSLATVVDSFGNDVVVYFSRPSSVSIYCSLDMATNSAFPAAGVTLAREAVVDYVSGLANGDDVTPFGVVSSLAAIPGIVGVTPYLGTSAWPTIANTAVSLAITEIAAIDTSQVSVN